MKCSFAAIIIILFGVGVWFVLQSSDDELKPAKATRTESIAGPRSTTSNQPDSSVALQKHLESEVDPSPESIRHVAVFDGEISLRVHSIDALSRFIPFHEEPIETYYEWLAAAASAGDTEAALELGFVLLRCVGYATTEDELSDKVDRMTQTLLVENAYKQSSRLLDNIHPYIEIERQRYELCKGLSKEQVMGSDDWFDLAAELGDYFAQAGAMERSLEQYWLTVGVEDAVETFDDFSQELGRFAEQQPERFQQSFNHLEDARRSGSVQALRDLAMLYYGSVIPPPNVYSPTANAYANLLAASEIFKQIWGPGSYTYQDELRSMSATLGKYELEWAEAQARSILREPNCCNYP